MNVLDALAWFDGATFGLVMVACIGGIIWRIVTSPTEAELRRLDAEDRAERQHRFLIDDAGDRDA